MDSPAILIVEDNDKNMKLFSTLFELRGFAPVGVSTGTAAVAYALAHSPDLVLMDVGLPDMDGTEALRLLRADSRTSHIPVVAVTAYAMVGDRERLLAAGFTAYIAKPIDVATFVDTVLAARSSPP